MLGSEGGWDAECIQYRELVRSLSVAYRRVRTHDMPLTCLSASADEYKVLSCNLRNTACVGRHTFSPYPINPTLTMPLGILEDHKLEHVPGTSPLNELGRLDDAEIQGIDSRMLKHDPTGQVVLVPQPSDSPNDPYNWPRWKKEMFTVAIAYGCGCVGGKSGCGSGCLSGNVLC